MASDENHNTERQETEEEQAGHEKLVAEMLGDEAARSLLIQKLKESGHVGKDIAPASSGGLGQRSHPSIPLFPFPLRPSGDQSLHRHGV